MEAWAFDQHRVGLQPILRRVWAPKGNRPVVPVQPRYEWVYGYAFVQPSTGRTYWLLLPTVNAAIVSQALALFAGEVGAGPNRRILLTLDQAGFHTAQAVEVPEGLERAFLPAHSPELQPAERHWPLLDQALANHHFADRAALLDVLEARCLELREQPEVIRAHTRYHWWPEAA